MLRQYHASPRQGGPNPLGVGTVALGSIFYLQDGGYWNDRFGGTPMRRNPWIVEAFVNGTYAAHRRDPDTGRWLDLVVANRTDAAVVRSLRDGRRQTVAVRTLRLHDDHGLTLGETRYPSLPDITLHPRGHQLAPAVPAQPRQRRRAA